MRLALLPCLLLGCTDASGKTRVDEAPLVVELFTSQGCSSCPPAERLVAKIAHDGTVGGRPVVPLAFHVDYWDDLGWTDPFALPAWTERQHEYARALGDRSVYTPQLVVGGRVGLIGSNTARAVQAIAAAPAQMKIAASATWSRSSLTVSTTAPAGADVFVAIWQDAPTTKVQRGENAGSTLGGEHVVRRLERVARAGKPGTTTIALDPAWTHVGAIAFAQNSDRVIVGSALLPRE